MSPIQQDPSKPQQKRSITNNNTSMTAPASFVITPNATVRVTSPPITVMNRAQGTQRIISTTINSPIYNAQTVSPNSLTAPSPKRRSTRDSPSSNRRSTSSASNAMIKQSTSLDYQTIAQSFLDLLVENCARKMAIRCAQLAILPTLPCPHCRCRCWRWFSATYSTGTRSFGGSTSHGIDIYGKRPMMVLRKALAEASATISETKEISDNFVDKEALEKSAASQFQSTSITMMSSTSSTCQVPCTECGKLIDVQRYTAHLERCLADHVPSLQPYLARSTMSRRRRKRQLNTSPITTDADDDEKRRSGKASQTNRNMFLSDNPSSTTTASDDEAQGDDTLYSAPLDEELYYDDYAPSSGGTSSHRRKKTRNSKSNTKVPSRKATAPPAKKPIDAHSVAEASSVVTNNNFITNGTEGNEAAFTMENF